jgi:hypothetical protein
MEIMRVTIKSIAGSIKSLTAILAAATLILTSCRDDAASTVTLYPVVSSNVETVVETRALSSDYKAFEVVGTRIQAYALAFNKYIDIRVSGNDADGIFLRKIPGWTSTLEVTHDLRYRVYAYSPAPFPAETISFDYNGGTPKLTFTGLSVITETDPMASVAAAGGTGDTPATDFSEGSFSIGVVNILTSPKTKVWLAMNHIYSKATISFVVNAGYDAIRTIVLKNATVSIPTGILPGLSTYTFAVSGAENSAVNGAFPDAVANHTSRNVYRSTAVNTSVFTAAEHRAYRAAFDGYICYELRSVTGKFNLVESGVIIYVAYGDGNIPFLICCNISRIAGVTPQRIGRQMFVVFRIDLILC